VAQRHAKRQGLARMETEYLGIPAFTEIILPEDGVEVKNNLP
jgi:hypothetical protein